MRIDLDKPVHLPTLAAELGDDRLSIIEAAGSPAVLVWHDVHEEAARAHLLAVLEAHVLPPPPPPPDPDGALASALVRVLERPEIAAALRAAVGRP